MANPKPIEWDHGFKTDYVVGTRYRNRSLGFYLGFTFPKQPYDCDRAETFDFLVENGGRIYQFGGYPGAEILVGFDGVKDKDTASVRLMDILPRLDAHMRNLE